MAATTRDPVGSAIDLLCSAAEKVPQHYFQLPIAGSDSEEQIYRERVYAYELYHQFRILMDESNAFPGLILCGEVDKLGHRLLRPYKPDLVLHVPRDMENNLLVVEIKSPNATSKAIRKDLDSLEHFLDVRKYQAGAYLVYGGQESDIQRFERELSRRRDGTLRRVWLLWHQTAGSRPVVRVNPEAG